MLIFSVSILAILFLAIGAAGDVSAQQVKMKTVKSEKGWLGVSIQDITSQMQKAMDLKSRDGALVGEVTEKSPAESAGIKEGDVIVQFAGKDIEDANGLQKAVADSKPESKVPVVVMRKGEKKTIDVVLGKSPAMKRTMIVSPRSSGGAYSFSFGGGNQQGMSLRELNEQIGQYFGVTDGTGVVVWEVEKGSAADKAGVKAGDVISMIGKKKIHSLRDVNRALGIFDDGEKAEIDVTRKGTRQTLSLEVQDSEENAGNHFWFNAPPIPKHRGGVFFNGGEMPFEFDMPNIEVETVRPEMEKLNIELNQLRGRLQDQTKELRQKIDRDVRSRVRVHVMEGV